MEDLVGCSPWGREQSDTTERLHFHFSLACIGEGNGNPLQCSCLENPRDGGAWWAAVCGVTQSWTRVNRLSSRSSSPDSSVCKESTCNAGGPSSIPRLGRSAGERICYPLQYSWAALVAQLVKNPPAMWETWVWSLGWEGPLEKWKTSISAWRIPWTIQPMGSQRVRLSDFHFHFLFVGKLLNT